MRFLPTILCISLNGCASFDYDWKHTRAPAPRPWQIVEVIDTDFTCRTLGGDPLHKLEQINGCAQWGLYGCTMYVPVSSPKWIIEHERKHCEGWIHE